MIEGPTMELTIPPIPSAPGAQAAMASAVLTLPPLGALWLKPRR